MLDAPIALAWCFEVEGRDRAHRVLGLLRKEEAVAPSLRALEAANRLLTAERRGRMDPAAASRAGHLLHSLPVVLEPPARSRPFPAIHPLARKHRRSAYDGAYLELAARRGISLATPDNGLRKAAGREGLEVLDPS